MSSSPVVSIVVVSYNSEKFILDTLESIFSQTYENIELIITDDSSTDNTIVICEEWLVNHSSHFVRTKLIKAEINTGVSANANRGLNYAAGEWLKFLGADDMLFPDCISMNLQYLLKRPEIKVLFSKVAVYDTYISENNLLKIIPNEDINESNIMWEGRSAKSQYNMLLVCDRIHFTPSVIMRKDTLQIVGGFDERFRTMEDYPLWLNLTKAGFKLYFMNIPTVKYRQHTEAINNTGIDYLIKPNYFRTEEFREIYTYPFLPTSIRLKSKWIWIASQIFKMNKLNKNTKFNKALFELLTIWLNPFVYFLYFKELMIREFKNKN